MTDPGQKEKRPTDLPALILCGGRSRRMGKDKAFLPLGSGTVLQKVQKAFAELSGFSVLVIGQQAMAPEQTGFDSIVRDEHEDFGPLEGLRVGLQHLSEHDFVFVGTCDAPLVVPDVYRLMLTRLLDSNHGDVALPVIQGQPYPLTAVYRIGVLAKISQMIGDRQLRVRDLLKKINVVELSESDIRQVDPNLDTTRNINTRAEYQQMLKEMKEY